MLEGLTWRKSSISDGQGGECVEVAWPETRAAIRDSKNAAGPHLALPRGSFAAMLQAMNAGRFTG
jgi:Domain of unknown function (DUF397)